MVIRTIPINQINPAPYNPRVDLQPGDEDYELLAKGLEQVGLVEPLVWNERSGHLVGGHQRLKILLAAGAREVECSVVDLDEPSEQTLNLALNKLGGAFDMQKVKDLLESLNTGAMDMDLTGFSEAEMADLMSQFHVPGADETGSVPDADAIEHPVPTRGDVWLLGAHRVMCGDSTTIADVERLMAGTRAVGMATDPPYGVDYQQKARDMEAAGFGFGGATRFEGDMDGDGVDAGQAEGLWRDAFNMAIQEAITDRAAWYVWHASGRAQTGLYNLLTELGVLIHQTIIWRKNNFVISRCDYHSQFEPCVYGWMKGNRPEFYGPRNQSTVWDFPRDHVTEHPTQKPVDLFLPPVTNHTRVGEAVYDPFAGSGPAIIACEQMGRVCYAMDKEPRYVQVCIERWQRYAGAEAVLESSRQTFSDVMAERTAPAE